MRASMKFYASGQQILFHQNVMVRLAAKHKPTTLVARMLNQTDGLAIYCPGYL